MSKEEMMDTYTFTSANEEYLEPPKKRFSIISILSKARNLCVLTLVIILVYAVWPQLHLESYNGFRLFLLMLY